MLCIYKRGGRHYYVEIQINLVEMVAIKAGEGGKEMAAATTGGKKSKKEATDDEMVGGHDAFNTARVIDAFSKRSLEYSGDPSDALWKMIAAGSLLRVGLDKATITDAQVKQLVEAMASDQCRVKELSMLGCKSITTIPEGLWVLMEASKVRKSNPDVLDLREWEDLRELPDSVWKLTHLKTLNLYKCKNLETLPDSLGKLTHLKTLNLEWCENLVTLPETGVAGLVNLEELNLGNCRKLKKQLPQSIAKLTKLKTLDLMYCYDIETLPETVVVGLVTLEALDLRYCEVLKQLPQSIAKLTKLKTLNVSNCESLAEPLPDLSHLLPGLEIDVYDASDAAQAWNKRGLTSLANHATTMKMLTDGTLHTYTDALLTLAGSNIDTLPHSLGKLTHLKMLNVSYCNNLETLPETGVAGLVNLEVLYLRECKKLKQLPQSIAKLTKLKTLDMARCRNLETLPETGVTGLVNLEELNLWGCLTLKQLPQSIAKLTKLKTLNLEDCKNLETLPETGVAGLVNLEELNLCSCLTLKQLPQSIATLTKLKKLRVWRCWNLETVPETGVAGLVNLEALDLADCRKLKQLPQSIAKLTKLKTLNLYQCESLAEPLPDLSHLPPGLEINVYNASDAAKAWEKRGFTSLAN
eukprot:gene16760-biopygen28204